MKTTPTQPNPTIPMNPDTKEPAASLPREGHLDRLISAVTKTRGLLYALASLAARPPDNKIVHEPMDEESQGLVWLALDLGQELGNASDEYIKAQGGAA